MRSLPQRLTSMKPGETIALQVDDVSKTGRTAMRAVIVTAAQRNGVEVSVEMVLAVHHGRETSWLCLVTRTS